MRSSRARKCNLRAVIAVASVLLGAWSAAARTESGADFAQWMSELEAEALERGISQQTLDSTLRSVKLIDRVVTLDRSQPKAPKDFCGYMEKRLTEARIERGRRALAEHRDLLAEISEDYGVPARYLVALWGLETNFGDYMGEYPLLDALVTLARDPRRGGMFRDQVFAALRIIDEGHHPYPGLVGSWAGATGQVQFMPTTFIGYAVDRDGDGRKDVWNSVPDALASAAHYLRRSGWRSGETWGRQVRLPAKLDRGRRPLAVWQQLGVRRSDGTDLPVAGLNADVVLPMRKPDPAFLVYRNYRTFLSWNQSTFFALSVGTLADELGGVGSLRICGS